MKVDVPYMDANSLCIIFWRNMVIYSWRPFYNNIYLQIDGNIGNGRGRAHSFHQFLPGFRAMQKQVFVPGWRSSLTSWQRLLLKDQRNLEVRAMTQVCVSYNLCCYSLIICYQYLSIFTTCYCFFFLISLLVLLTMTIRIVYLFIIQRGLRLKSPRSPPSHAERRWWKFILSGTRIQVILVAIQVFRINYTQIWPVFFHSQNHHEVSAETLGIE